MSIRKRRPTPVTGTGLDPAVEDLLVVGPSEADPFLEFTLSIDEIRALVRAHAAALQAAATRRGLRRPWAMTCYGTRAARPRRAGRT